MECPAQNYGKNNSPAGSLQQLEWFGRLKRYEADRISPTTWLGGALPLVRE